MTNPLSIPWALALTIAERLALPAQPEDVSDDLLFRRLRLWRRELNVEGKEELFQELIGFEGLSVERLSELLSSRAEVEGQPQPQWVTVLQEAYAEAEPPAEPMQNLRVLILPLVQYARRALLAQTAGLADFPGDRAACIEQLMPPLEHALAGQVGRTLILELHVAREEGRLQGETPEERYQDYVRQLVTPEFWQPFYEEYTVLARRVVQTTLVWIAHVRAFFEDLTRDHSALQETFGPGIDTLAEVDSGAGDTHRGRSVCLVKFASGQKLVYKPRSLAVDTAFNGLLEWLNARGIKHPLRFPRLLERPQHGWVEFVEARGCEAAAEVERFYWRQGAFLALLYGLAATDFHMENVIAAGEHPVLIDLEALFHPLPRQDEQAEVQSPEMGSVMQVGLLPQRSFVSAENPKGIELGGLGGAGGQVAPRGMIYAEGAGTDQMRIERKDIELSAKNNRPKWSGEEVAVEAYLPQILLGFEEMYAFLLEHREALLAPSGPLEAFRDVEVRFIARATNTYGLLLREGVHPDYQRRGIDFDRFLSRLCLGSYYREYLRPLLPSERRDLNEGDIPLFWTRPGSQTLWDSRDQPLLDYLQEPSLETARRRLQGLSERDLRRQRSMIHQAFTALTVGEGHRVGRLVVLEGASPCTPDLALAEAERLADELLDLGYENDEALSWLGLQLSQGVSWQVMPLSTGLYGGLSGLALLFGGLGACTGKARYTEAARRALRLSDWLVKRTLAQDGRSLIGYSELAGEVYVRARLGALWDEPSLLERAGSWCEAMTAKVGQDEIFDVIGGAAGGIVGVYALYELNQDGRARDFIQAAAEHLLAHREGQSWKTMNGKAILGFSHGQSGIAWALGLAWSVTGEQRYKDAALDALNYERQFLDETQGNWPDLREEDLGFMWAWCHGAPGIALARAGLLKLWPEEQALARDLEVAIQSTLARGFGGNQSLCHGDLGNLDCVLTCAELMGRRDWREAVWVKAGQIYAAVQERGTRCGVPTGADTPGLFVGLAGISLGWLRLAYPEKVPSVLLGGAPDGASKSLKV